MSRSEQFWDRAASTYDREERKDEAINVRIVEKTRQYLKKSDVLLDYGCGTGTIDIEIAEDVKEILGIDTSPKMIFYAERKASEHQIYNIHYEQAAIFDERLTAGSFDVITAANILHLVLHPEAVMKRVHELLKPGGLFISTTPCMRQVWYLNLILQFAVKIGLVPKVKAFKHPEIEKMIAGGSFQIMESVSAYRGKPIWFVAARKR